MLVEIAKLRSMIPEDDDCSSCKTLLAEIDLLKSRNDSCTLGVGTNTSASAACSNCYELKVNLGMLEIELKEWKEKFEHDRIRSCENCPILASENDELKNKFGLLKIRNNLLEHVTSKRPIETCCSNCANLEAELKDAKHAVSSIASHDSCASCISQRLDLTSVKKEFAKRDESLAILEADLVASKECVKRDETIAEREKTYLQQSLERFT
uniref:Uncharacterized protein n=1 Tax=Leersia perrieri TaxID=77586 RepID=A0A0D9XDG8_9ORYZ